MLSMSIKHQQMAKLTLEQRLERVYAQYEGKMKSEGMAFQVEDGKGEFKWQRETGALKGDKSFPVASVTKLYVTAVIMKLVDEGKLSLESKIAQYLPREVVQGLHIYKGKDYSEEITIKQLIAQTSGLPDYYTEGVKGKPPLEQQIGEDPELCFEEVLTLNKQLSPHFEPDKKGKAFYSDMNFDLLGQIIENVTHKTLNESFNEYIYQPLGLKNTYVFEKGMAFDFPSIWIKGQSYKIPNLLASMGASGGIVATKTEMMLFLKAFWQGRVFDKSHLEEMKKYNSIQFFPMQYGVGHMRYKMPGAPEIIGHSGSTGVLCYYVPQYDVYITGCINEVDEAKATQMVLELADCFKYEKVKR